MAKEKKMRWEPEKPAQAASESIASVAPQASVQAPAPAQEKHQGQKVSVDLYLRAHNVPVWERGGRRAFAVSKGLEFGTEQQFDELFKKY